MKTHGAYRLAVLAACALVSAGCGSGGRSTTSTIPAAPTGVTATPGNAQVTVAWAAVSGATSYNLYWSTTPGVTQASGTRISGAASPYAHTGLTNGTTYYYVVTAANAEGESADSSQASAVPAVNPAPAAPGVNAIAGNAQVTISWSPVTGATSYNIYWSTTAGVTTANGTQIAGASNPYVHTNLTNGTTYHYVVTAVNGNGESTPSSEVSATPSSLPTIQVLVLSVQGGGVPAFGFLEQAKVCSDSGCTTPIDNAIVTVNGAALTYDSSHQQYVGTQAIAAGASVTVDVSIGGNTFAATGTQFTSYPSITAPASGATWASTSPQTISWTGGGPTAGASYVVGVMDATGNFVFPSGAHGPEEVPLSTTSVVVPANSLSTGSDQILVGIGTTGIVHQASGGISIAGASAGSGLWLGAIAAFVPVTVQ